MTMAWGYTRRGSQEQPLYLLRNNRSQGFEGVFASKCRHTMSARASAELEATYRATQSTGVLSSALSSAMTPSQANVS